MVAVVWFLMVIYRGPQKRLVEFYVRNMFGNKEKALTRCLVSA